MTTDTHSSPAVPVRATVFVGRWPKVPVEEGQWSFAMRDIILLDR